jgi:hypothetical protein
MEPMKETILFSKASVLHKYGTVEKEDDFMEYQRIVFGAHHEERPKGGGTVYVRVSSDADRDFPLEPGTELTREGPGYRFQSSGSLYTIGPIMEFHNLEFFSGIPMTALLMEQLAGTPHSFLISPPRNPDELIENIYIKKADGSFLTRKNLRWAEVRAPDPSPELLRIVGASAALVTTGIDRESPFSAQTLSIATTSDPVQL